MLIPGIRKITILFIFFLVACTSLTKSSNDSDKPDWVKKPPVENSTHRFYVGRAYGVKTHSEEDLMAQASQNAHDRAIEENFGIFTSLSTKSYETTHSFSVVTRRSKSSKNVILKRFRKKGQHIESKGDKKEIWLLFEYPKKEIKLEIQRLKNVDPSENQSQFSEFNASQSLEGGTLQIVTSPPGAKIVINGESSYGMSPATIRGLKQGVHSVVLDHPYFERIEEDVIISHNEMSKMDKTMTRSERTLLIQTRPEGASIDLDGKYLGLSPVNTVVPTGKKLPLSITHQETKDYQETIDVGKGDDVHVIKVDLKLKPSFLYVKSIPSGADVYLEDKLINKKTPTGFFEVTPGEFINIVVVKDGYHKYTETIEIRGGERRTLPTIKLERDFSKLSAVVKRRLILQNHFSIGLAYMGPSRLRANLKKLTSNGVSITEDLDDVSLDVNFESTYGISLEYTNFINNYFFSVGLDIMKESQDANVDDSFIQPISLFSNIGWTKSINDNSYLKLFLGAGLSDLRYDEQHAIKSDPGPLLQVGIGVVQRQVLLDLIFRAISGESTFKSEVEYRNKKYDVKETTDFLFFAPILRLGIRF